MDSVQRYLHVQYIQPDIQKFYKMWPESMDPSMSPSILCTRGCSDLLIALNNPNYPRNMTLMPTFDRKNNYFGNLN